MATIETDNDFVNAVNWLISQGQLPVIASRFVDAPNRKVWDETTPLTDITPSILELENALDAANVETEQDTANENQNTIDRQTLLAQYQTALNQILNDTDSINSAKNALDSATTLGQVKPIFDETLNILHRQLTREVRLLKALRAIVQSDTV